MYSTLTAYFIGVVGIIILAMGFAVISESGVGEGFVLVLLGVVILGTAIFVYKNTNKKNNEFKDIIYEYQQIIKSDNPTPDDLNKIKEKIKLKYDYEVQIIDNNCISNVYKEKETDIKSKNKKETIKQIDTLNNKGNDKFIKISLNKKDTSYTFIIYESSFKEDNSKIR